MREVRFCEEVHLVFYAIISAIRASSSEVNAGAATARRLSASWPTELQPTITDVTL